MGLTPRALVVFLALACSDEARVGVVDVQQAFQRSPLAMVSAHRIKGDLGGDDRELKARGRALAEVRRQLEHGDLELDADQRASAEAQLADATLRLAAAQRLYRTELDVARRRRGEELIAQVEEMAREVAQREGVMLLLLKQGELYDANGAPYTGEANVAESVDLTEQVARALLAKINPTEIPSAPAERESDSSEEQAR